MLHPDPFNRASIDSIKRHGFLSDQIPNSLPVSALRVPPARISKNSVESEPRVLFVCLEPTWATAENRSRSEAPGRWRLCSSASSMAPAGVEPSQGTHQYQVLTDAKIYIFMFGRPFVTALWPQTGDIVTMLERAPDGSSGTGPARIRTEHGWVDCTGADGR